MKKTIKKIIQSGGRTAVLIAFGFALAAGTAVLAYTAPTGLAPSGNVPAPINTGAVAQTKTGVLTVANNIVSSGGDGYGLNSYGYIIGKDGIFSRYFEAGVHSGWTLVKGLIVDQVGKVAVIGDDDISTVAPIVKIENTGPNTKFMNLFQVKSNQGGLSVFSRGGLSTFTDTAASVTQVNGNLSVDKEIYIHGGNPAAGKVLISKDAGGTAEWGGGSTSTSGPDGLIKYVRAPISTGSAASAFCGTDAADDANWIAIGGGGYCQWGTQISQPALSRSGSAHQDGHRTEPAIGWHLDCLDKMMDGGGGQIVGEGGDSGYAKAEVVCMKRTSVLTGITTTTPTGSTGGGTSAPTPGWHLATGSGNPGESCVQWLTRTQQGVISDVGVDIGPWGFLNFKHDTTGGKTNCAYSYPSQQIIPGSNVPGKTSCYYGSGTSNPGANATPVATCTDANAVTPAYNGTGTVQSVTATTWFYK